MSLPVVTSPSYSSSDLPSEKKPMTYLTSYTVSPSPSSSTLMTYPSRSQPMPYISLPDFLPSVTFTSSNLSSSPPSSTTSASIREAERTDDSRLRRLKSFSLLLSTTTNSKNI